MVPDASVMLLNWIDEHRYTLSLARTSPASLWSVTHLDIHVHYNISDSVSRLICIVCLSISLLYN